MLKRIEQSEAHLAELLPTTGDDGSSLGVEEKATMALQRRREKVASSRRWCWTSGEDQAGAAEEDDGGVGGVGDGGDGVDDGMGLGAGDRSALDRMR